MKTTDIEYSIILPCLNEEKTLGICIRKIHQFFSNTGLTYEIIVADNGSTDNSALVAKNNRADVIQVSQKGYGSAMGNISLWVMLMIVITFLNYHYLSNDYRLVMIW